MMMNPTSNVSSPHILEQAHKMSHILNTQMNGNIIFMNNNNNKPYYSCDANVSLISNALMTSDKQNNMKYNNRFNKDHQIIYINRNKDLYHIDEVNQYLTSRFKDMNIEQMNELELHDVNDE